MRQRDPDIGVECIERGVQPAGDLDGVFDEVLHLALPEGARALAREPAAKALHSGHPQLAPAGVECESLAFEHPNAVLLQQIGHFARTVAVVVVVAEDRDDRHVEPGELVRHHLGLVHAAVPGEIAGEQQHVCVVADVLEGGPQASASVLAKVHVSHGGNPDHRSSSLRVGSRASTIRTSLCTRIRGASSPST